MLTMNWKIKSAIQNLIELLPDKLSYEAYYRAQRYFGGLRKLNPSSRLIAGIDIWRRIEKHGQSPIDKVFFEVGTGRVPIVPLAFWLMGAKGVISIDLNRYLKEELVRECLQIIYREKDSVADRFGLLMDKDRFKQLLSLGKEKKTSVEKLFNLCNIKYIAPGDAANTHLTENSVDFHTSYTVFEHIPLEHLKSILIEGNRIVKKDGLFVHKIDYSDHFSHTDNKISVINFLQYSHKQWRRYAGNKYMYMNRLRHDDFETLFRSVGHSILEADIFTDPKAENVLRFNKIKLCEEFRLKGVDVLAVTGSWMITKNLSK
jgi:hypothetical protein